MQTHIEHAIPENYTMQCMEIRGGNGFVNTSVKFPGLDAWVYSAPCERAEAGGDIHYVSLCGMGLLSRFAVVDLAGHGASAAGMSRSVYGLMNEHINTIDQAAFARSINREMGRLDLGGRFATAILVSYINADKSLLLCNAGHPPPLHRSAREAGWSLLTPNGEGVSTIGQGDSEYLSDLPLGIIDPTEFRQFAVRLSEGDHLVVYTDSLIESADAEGRMLGTEGLLELVADIRARDSTSVVDQLLTRLNTYRGVNQAQDDETILALTVVSSRE